MASTASSRYKCEGGGRARLSVGTSGGCAAASSAKAARAKSASRRAWHPRRCMTGLALLQRLR